MKGMTMTTTHTLAEEDLAQFTGTEHHYKHALMRNVLYSDGAKYVADAGGAHWLLDIIASMQLDAKVRKEEFQVWKLTLDDDQETRIGMSSAVLTCEDGNGNEVYRQIIDYTDFPLPEIRFYYTNNVIHLPSEY